jgi:hypothetical protein
MGRYKVNKCLFTEKPARNLEGNFDGFEYEIEYNGVKRVIRLEYFDLGNNWWFYLNKHRIFNKVAQNGHWVILEEGYNLDELLDYLVAPPKVLNHLSNKENVSSN